MHAPSPPQATRELAEALDLMNRALTLLDEADAPGRIGATLDLAISGLSAVVCRGEHASGSVQSLVEELERELSQASQPELEHAHPWENP